MVRSARNGGNAGRRQPQVLRGTAAWGRVRVEELSTTQEARYAISVDGTVRTYRDVREAAFEVADVLKACKPYSKVVVCDRRTGEEIYPSEDAKA